jgi:hypothetical protein
MKMNISNLKQAYLRETKFIVALCLIVFSLSACTGKTSFTEQDLFFDQLSALCGQVFEGQSTFPEAEDHPLVGTPLRTEVNECSESMVRIELIRDGDYWHGAWVIEKRPEGLHLFHDHLGEKRTMEDLGEDDYHGYGGYANSAGNSTAQYFEADSYTAELIPAAATNVWMIEIGEDGNSFIYSLERNQQPRFRAEFFLK